MGLSQIEEVHSSTLLMILSNEHGALIRLQKLLTES